MTDKQSAMQHTRHTSDLESCPVPELNQSRVASWTNEKILNHVAAECFCRMPGCSYIMFIHSLGIDVAVTMSSDPGSDDRASSKLSCLASQIWISQQLNYKDAAILNAAHS